MRNKIIIVSIIAIAGAVIFSGLVWSSEAQNLDRSLSQKTLIDKSVADSATSRFAPTPLNWRTVVNNGFAIPDGTHNFSSYSQPSINKQNTVVFRARSTGGGTRDSGIYMRRGWSGPISKVADINTLVPYPNNLDSEFLEFSAFPRIAQNSDYMAFAGLHQPVYRYFLPDGSEARIGTAGIYARLDSGAIVSGASKLGALAEFDMWSVTNTKGLPFDIFPGGSAITDDGKIVFKGNFNENGIGKTGIFFRSLFDTMSGGDHKTQIIASSDTEIPDMPPHAWFRAFTFDSTSPPTVANDQLVFLALDNEQNPHFGGIYSAPIEMPGMITKVIGIGELVPGVAVTEIKTIGEGLSFDGRYLSFWATWGKETKTVRLYCPEDGNPDIVAYCNGVDPLSIYDVQTDRWYQEREVYVKQGFFVYDMTAGHGYLAAQTKVDSDEIDVDFDDFVYWNYSGKVPGTTTDIDAEPPRWRSASFGAVSDGMIAFKARTGLRGTNNEYIDPVDGIYIAEPATSNNIVVVAETGMDGAVYDDQLLPGTMPVTEMGIEREGLRGTRLAISLSMANAEEDWGGIYLVILNQSPTVKDTEKKEIK